MQLVFHIVLPVFGVVALGYGASRLGWFGGDVESGLAKFVFDFAVPIMLFRSLATAELPGAVPWGYLVSYYGSAAVIYLFGFLLARYGFGRTYGGQVITGFGFAFGNTVLLGLPLALTALGDKAALPYFILLSIHSLLFFTVTTFLLEMDRHSEAASWTARARQIGHSLVTNPILMGIVFGLAFNLVGIPLPGPVEAICALMQQAVTPCALFSLGASLTKYGFAGRLGQSVIMVTAKTVLMPALVYLLTTRVFTVDPLWTLVAVIMAAQPSGVMTYIFAEKYGVGQAIATTSIFLSTTLSVVTLSVILYLLGIP